MLNAWEVRGIKGPDFHHKERCNQQNEPRYDQAKTEEKLQKRIS
jgi:hypothetical protein